jgi:glyoxylase-like metal-dependent hydrolase (beta-lactamase superfamily II)
MRRASEVMPGVFVATSRKMFTTSVILVGGDDALLVDPAWLPDELEATGADIDGLHLRVIGGFATHAHHDHLLWHPAFGLGPRWASETTAALAAAGRSSLVEQLGSSFPRHLVDLMGRVQGVSENIPLESVPAGFDIELIIHDGHAPGHTALWLPRQRILLAGDMLSDVELPLPFYPDDIPAYIDALDLLAPFAAAADLIIPGHGHIGSDARRRLDADRRYIDDMLRDGSSADPRMANPGMTEEHSHMQYLVGGSGQPQ